jgi:hypothetical protein
MKTTKSSKPIHTANTKIGKGTFNGIGVKNPIMKPKEVIGLKSNKGMGKTPKSLA